MNSQVITHLLVLGFPLLNLRMLNLRFIPVFTCINILYILYRMNDNVALNVARM